MCLSVAIQSSELTYLPVERLHLQAQSLVAKFKEGGGINYIDKAIGLDREALEHCPPGHPQRSVSLTWLSIHLSDRHSQLGEMEDLAEAIVLDREALTLRPQGHASRSASLNNLAFRLSARYDQLGVMEDLAEAIVLDREALALRPQGHSERSVSLSNLGVDLSTRYNQLGGMEDLDEAIVLGREALALRPQGHPDRSISLNNLAVRLSTRYDQLGGVEDLTEAIALGREALTLRPQGHRDRSISLSNLAVDLSIRYNQLGAMEDLDEAIVLDREALALRPQGHPGRSRSLGNLGVRLSTRHKQLGGMEDLIEAIILDREALTLRPRGHPDRSGSLSNLALDLSTRYKQLGVMEDLDEAIVLGREALGLRTQEHPDRSASLGNLAADLSTRYNQLKATEDLDEAIVLGREALALRPQGHPHRSTSLDNLARCLRIRFTQSNQLRDKEELFSLYEQLVHVPQFVSSTDLSAAKSWIHMAEDFHHPATLLAYKTSLRLLMQHLAVLPSLPRHLAIVKDLTSSLAVDAFSACLRNSSPARAVELLEQGRGVFWSLLSRLHAPLDDVIACSPGGKTLADEFARLALLINNTLKSPGPHQHERLCGLNVELQRVVTNIRSLPDLSRFLLSPLFSDLRCAANRGPVIIVSASKYSCDALIVFLKRDPVHIPLQVTQDDVRRLSTEFQSLTVRAKATKEHALFLRKLWTQVVSPIVDCLQMNQPYEPRIWWCPTAEFSLLPLHAAGPFMTGEKNLPELYISSYTPTLTALIRARRPVPPNFSTEEKRFLAIGQADAPDESELPFVGEELDNVCDRVDGLARFTRIDGEESCAPRVVEELGKNEWIHFACHGLPNREQPFESAFALHDGHFTIQRIIGCDLKNPEFAYLSACHTTVGDEESPDEVIHLASAMQFAGFRSVIGTMWAVNDGLASDIASTFYEHMVDESGHLHHTRAAFALNETMKSIRSLDQATLYIHLGA